MSSFSGEHYSCDAAESFVDSGKRLQLRNSRGAHNHALVQIEIIKVDGGRMTLHEIQSVAEKEFVWEKFRAHHYTPDRWNHAARVFLATETFEGRELIVGMSAALAAPPIKNAWRSHKVVVLPLGLSTGVWKSAEKILLPDFDRTQMWRLIADAQAALFVGAGYRYYCNAGDAPTELIAYRDDPASGWVPTSKNGKAPRDKGHGQKYGNKSRATNADGLVVSHWYVGTVEEQTA